MPGMIWGRAQVLALPSLVQLRQFSVSPHHRCDTDHRVASWPRGMNRWCRIAVPGDEVGGVSLASPWLTPGLSAPEVEVVLVDHRGHGFRSAIARDPGELASRQPSSFVPKPGFQQVIESREFPLEAGLTRVWHDQLLCGGYSKARG